MLQILMFILLGLLVFPEQLTDIFWQGIALSLLLMFIARPIGVFLSIPRMGFNFREKVFISWSGLKGAVPIVLATYPMIEGIENSQLLFNIVFFVVFASTLIQGSTITPLANWLGLATGEKMTSPYSLELVAMGKTNAEIIEIVLEEGSPAANLLIRELKLPQDVLITAIVRNNKVVTPKGSTQLFAGDILYILIEKPQRDRVKSIFLQNKLASLEA
jgi:cell volume regulation protein A